LNRADSTQQATLTDWGYCHQQYLADFSSAHYIVCETQNCGL